MTPTRFHDTPKARVAHVERVGHPGAALLRADRLAAAVVKDAFQSLPPGRGSSLSSRLHRFSIAQGSRSWEQLIDRGLEGKPAEFHPPTKLASQRA